MAAAPAWYETFFEGIALDLWDRIVPPEQTAREAAFLAETFGPPPARLLDVPCGNGRHALALAARGYAVTGVDLAIGYIATAPARAAAAGVDVTWRHADMRDLPPAAVFDGAYCFGNSFGYLDPPGMRDFVAAVARALRPGGRFVVDSGLVAESILPNLETSFALQVDDIHFAVENAYEVDTSTLVTTCTFLRDGVADTRVVRQGVYTTGEIGRLLDGAGLRVAAQYGSFAREPYRVGDQLLVLVAEKR